MSEPITRSSCTLPSRSPSPSLSLTPSIRRDDPLYLGVKEPRLRGEKYDALLAEFCDVVAKDYPGALLHFEDFGKENALSLLEKYRPKQSAFNDDIHVSELDVEDRSWKLTDLSSIGNGCGGHGVAQECLRGRWSRIEGSEGGGVRFRESLLLSRPAQGSLADSLLSFAGKCRPRHC